MQANGMGRAASFSELNDAFKNWPK
jgi:hypothetical protein